MDKKYPIKAMTVAEVLDVSVKLLQNNFKSFLLVTLFIAFPVSLAVNTVQHYTIGEDVFFGLLSDEEVVDDESVEFTTLDFAEYGLLFVELFIVAPITYGALVVLASARYLGEPMAPGRAFMIILGRAHEIVLGYFCSAMLIGLGLVLLIVPGVYFALRYYVLLEAMLLEKSSIEYGFRRSGALTTDNLASAFWISSLIGLIAIFAVFSASVVPFWPVAVVCQSLVNSLLSMFGAIVGVVFYYSCRCKHENFDVHHYALDVEADGAAVAEEPTS